MPHTQKAHWTQIMSSVLLSNVYSKNSVNTLYNTVRTMSEVC